MDLDGTLLDSRGTLWPENHQAVRRAADDGIAVAIVTGRRRSTFRAERDRLTDCVFRASVSNGAVLLAQDNETIERVHPLEWEPVLELLSNIPPKSAGRCLAVTVPGDGDAHELDSPDSLIITSSGDCYYARSLCEPELQEVCEENALTRTSALSRKLVHAALHVADESTAGDVVRLAQLLCPDATVYATRPPKAAGALVDIVAGGGKALAMLQAAAHRYAIAQSELAAVFPSAIPVSGRSAVAEALSSFARELSG